MVTMMGGDILVLLGLTGLGNAVKFIPQPIIIGFSSGIAVSALHRSAAIHDRFGGICDMAAAGLAKAAI